MLQSCCWWLQLKPVLESETLVNLTYKLIVLIKKTVFIICGGLQIHVLVEEKAQETLIFMSVEVNTNEGGKTASDH